MLPEDVIQFGKEIERNIAVLINVNYDKGPLIFSAISFVLDGRKELVREESSEM